ncbi:uncharacterized protein LOC110630649 [Manihot esculenta]|uniref:Uncharacterized protein n=1 Tax=Manihot esculenta TaxID=3983 RepID=A0A2C9UN50_MANES|nr:uncharacterized protein LOC110630649 [Manihot esculenta]OAY31939.1 hypothetical protein MANES_14G153500v8 [Manihot esculenta]
MGEYTDLHHHHQEEEEEETEVEVEEEALSLCDLPLEDDTKKMMSTNCRRSNSEPHEFFEFFSDLTSSMCSAEDIIFCGKLVPLNKEVSSPIQTLIPHSEQDKRRSSFCRRSESVPGLRSSVSRSNSISTTKLMMRSSRSLNYRKLERFSTARTSPEFDKTIDRSSSVRSIGKVEGMVKKTAKPRWYVLIFGVVKPPTEMELRDIKSRQVRRNSSTMMFPPPFSNSVKKPSIGKGSCKLLKILSCRDYTSVAVTTSFYIPPP